MPPKKRKTESGKQGPKARKTRWQPKGIDLKKSILFCCVVHCMQTRWALRTKLGDDFSRFAPDRLFLLFLCCSLKVYYLRSQKIHPVLLCGALHANKMGRARGASPDQ
jgi:hypothetical protein